MIVFKTLNRKIVNTQNLETTWHLNDVTVCKPLRNPREILIKVIK